MQYCNNYPNKQISFYFPSAQITFYPEDCFFFCILAIVINLPKSISANLFQLLLFLKIKSRSKINWILSKLIWNFIQWLYFDILFRQFNKIYEIRNDMLRIFISTLKYLNFNCKLSMTHPNVNVVCIIESASVTNSLLLYVLP